MCDRNRNGYQPQDGSRCSEGIFLPLAVGAVFGGMLCNIWDSVCNNEKPPKKKLEPQKMLRDMSHEEKVFLYENLHREFRCNLSLQIMKDPVMLECGHNFDRQILEHFLRNNTACPLCHENLTKRSFTTNFTLKSLIKKEVARLREKFKRKNSQKKHTIEIQIKKKIIFK